MWMEVLLRRWLSKLPVTQPDSKQKGALGIFAPHSVDDTAPDAPEEQNLPVPHLRFNGVVIFCS